jgi:GAF domain-containing protein
MKKDFKDISLEQLVARLNQRMEQDDLVQSATIQLRESLNADRVVMYHFYEEWFGQVTFESLSSKDLSILGYTGSEGCFNDGYAEMYKQGRVNAIADIEVEPIHVCHRDFLRSIKVRANLVAPVIVGERLWGLLIAHNTQSPKAWSAYDIEQIQQSAYKLAIAPSIQAI